MSKDSNVTSASKREKIVQNAKLAGNLVMYIGSAAIANAILKKTRENQNGLMSACAIGTGAMLSIGAGKMASGIFNRVVDKTVEFIDEVKPRERENKYVSKEDNSDEEDTVDPPEEKGK